MGDGEAMSASALVPGFGSGISALSNRLPRMAKPAVRMAAVVLALPNAAPVASTNCGAKNWPSAMAATMTTIDRIWRDAPPPPPCGSIWNTSTSPSFMRVVAQSARMTGSPLRRAMNGSCVAGASSAMVWPKDGRTSRTSGFSGFQDVTTTPGVDRGMALAMGDSCGVIL